MRANPLHIHKGRTLSMMIDRLLFSLKNLYVRFTFLSLFYGFVSRVNMIFSSKRKYRKWGKIPKVCPCGSRSALMKHLERSAIAYLSLFGDLRQLFRPPHTTQTTRLLLINHRIPSSERAIQVLCSRDATKARPPLMTQSFLSSPISQCPIQDALFEGSILF